MDGKRLTKDMSPAKSLTELSESAALQVLGISQEELDVPNDVSSERRFSKYAALSASMFQRCLVYPCSGTGSIGTC